MATHRRTISGHVTVEVTYGPHEVPITVECDVLDEPESRSCPGAQEAHVRRAWAEHPKTGREIRVNTWRLDHEEIHGLAIDELHRLAELDEEDRQLRAAGF